MECPSNSIVNNRIDLPHSPTKDEMDKCLLSSWYDTFKAVSIPTEILVIPDKIIQHLLEGNINAKNRQLGDEQTESSTDSESGDTNNIQSFSFNDRTSDNGDDVDDWGNEDSENVETSELELEGDNSEFMVKCSNCIKKFGGSVVPKMLWKVPKDANWALLKGPRCYNTDDIFTLLRASVETADLLTNPYMHIPSQTEKDQAINYLFLRQWKDFQSVDEFRVFICGGKLLGISQRDLTIGCQRIVEEKDSIIEDIYNFYRKNIYGRFELSHYSMDVVRFGPGYVFLLDFNILDDKSIANYYIWDELLEMWNEMSNQHTTGSELQDVQESTANQPKEPSQPSLTSRRNLPNPDKKHKRKESRKENDNFQSNLNLPQSRLLGNPYFRYSTKNYFHF